MATEESFLEAIAQEPDDDGLRLIFADWLEEQPDPATAARGQLIRVQCELVHTPEWDERRPALLARERNLLSTYQYGWLGPLREHLKYWRFRRGLLEIVVLDARFFLAHFSDVFRLGPVRIVGWFVSWGSSGQTTCCPNWRRHPPSAVCPAST
jgi:uncharacterized protein (TIGR02996 family)